MEELDASRTHLPQKWTARLAFRENRMADQGSEGLLSPYLRKKRIEAAKPYLTGRILDVGCGSGALAQFVDPSSYIGVDIDHDSLESAKRHFPLHTFMDQLPSADLKFTTVVSLAVIEHAPNVTTFLMNLASRLADDPESRIIITTPHPTVDWIHFAGSSIGLFSKHANEEHESLLGKKALAELGNEAGLTMSYYSRFLLFANQLAIFSIARV